jgi:hypothetical protein
MNQVVLKRRNASGKYTHEEMFNILSCEGTANQNDVKILVRMGIIKNTNSHSQ